MSAQLLDTCTFQHFRESLRDIQPGVRKDQDLRVTLIDTKPVDDTVEVSVRITRFRLDPPFGGNEYSHGERFVLERIDGAWRFTDPPWPMRWCRDLDQAPPPRRERID